MKKNFDLISNIYVREAFENKKWAFITDYVRLYVLYHYGGIYMDTDVEVIRPLDKFLYQKGFSGFERKKAVPTGIMACEKNLPLFKEFLAYYENRHFKQPDGTLDLTTNVTTITRILKKNGLKLNNRKQTIKGFTRIKW